MKNGETEIRSDQKERIKKRDREKVTKSKIIKDEDLIHITG